MLTSATNASNPWASHKHANKLDRNAPQSWQVYFPDDRGGEAAHPLSWHARPASHGTSVSAISAITLASTADDDGDERTWGRPTSPTYVAHA